MNKQATLGFLGGVAVTGAFFAGMGAGSMRDDPPVQKVEIVGIGEKVNGIKGALPVHVMNKVELTKGGIFEPLHVKGR